MFKQIELSEKDLKEVDQRIIEAIQGQRVGDSLEILLLTQDELKNYSEELADDRLKKLHSRLRQFKVISFLEFKQEGNQIIIILRDYFQIEQLKAQYLNASEVLLPIKNDEDVKSRIMKAIATYTDGDLFIDSLSDEQVSLANQRAKKLPDFTECKKNSVEKQRYDREIQALGDYNCMQISNWLGTHSNISETTLNSHKADLRFEQSPYPNRYQIKCPKKFVSQLIKELNFTPILTQVNLLSPESNHDVEAPELDLRSGDIVLPNYILDSIENDAFIRFREAINSFKKLSIKSEVACNKSAIEGLEKLFGELLIHAATDKKNTLIVVNQFTKLTQSLITPNGTGSENNIELHFKQLDALLTQAKPMSPKLIGLIVGAVIGFVLGAIIGAGITAFAGGFGAFATALIGALAGVTLVSGLGLGGACIGGVSGCSVGFFSMKKTSQQQIEKDTQLNLYISDAKQSLCL